MVEAIDEHSAGSGDLRCLDVGLWILRMCTECADLVGGEFLFVVGLWVVCDLMGGGRGESVDRGCCGSA